MSFQQGLSGLNAASKNLEVIGNNVSNANTVGFKQSQAQFSDVFANSLSGASGAQVGIGTKVSEVAQQFTQGSISASNNPLDIAINGQGFFRMSSNGAISFSRNGQFQLDKTGHIVNADGARLTGYTANASGILSSGAPSELQIDTTDIPANATTAVHELLNLDSRQGALVAANFDPNDPTTYNHSTAVSVYDSLGNAHTLQSFYVKTAPNTWSVFATNDGTQIGTGAIGTINFQTDGSINTTTTTSPFVVPLTVTTGATSPYNVSLYLDTTTQFGSNFGVNALKQDGFTSGRLTGFNTSADGSIIGTYTNGQSATLGQVVLATFVNPNGLKPVGNNLWVESSASGQPLVGVPDTGSLGVLQSAATEDSNVDLTAELVNMITAQRVYQANAQTIKTQDQILQTLVNLR